MKILWGHFLVFLVIKFAILDQIESSTIWTPRCEAYGNTNQLCMFHKSSRRTFEQETNEFMKWALFMQAVKLSLVQS